MQLHPDVRFDLRTDYDPSVLTVAEEDLDSLLPSELVRWALFGLTYHRAQSARIVAGRQYDTAGNSPVGIEYLQARMALQSFEQIAERHGA